jgi:hypothetical protein
MVTRSLMGKRDPARRNLPEEGSDLVADLLARTDYRTLARIDSVELVPLVVSKLRLLPPRLRVTACAQILARDPDCSVAEVLRELASSETPAIAIQAIVMSSPREVTAQWLRLCAWVDYGVCPILACDAIFAMETSLGSVSQSNKETFLAAARSCLEFSLSPVLTIRCAQLLKRQGCKVEGGSLLRVYLSSVDPSIQVAYLEEVVSAGVADLLAPHWRVFLSHSKDDMLLRVAKAQLLRTILGPINELEELSELADDPELLADIGSRSTGLAGLVLARLVTLPGSVTAALLRMDPALTPALRLRLVSEYQEYPLMRDRILIALLKIKDEFGLAEIARLAGEPDSLDVEILLIAACILITQAGAESRASQVAEWRLLQLRDKSEHTVVREIAANHSLITLTELVIPESPILTAAAEAVVELPDPTLPNKPVTTLHDLLNDFFADAEAPTASSSRSPETANEPTQLNMACFPSITQRPVILSTLEIAELHTDDSSLFGYSVDSERILSALQSNLGIGYPRAV